MSKSIIVKHPETKTIQIFRLGKTANKKICNDPKKAIVQTYTYSYDQYKYVRNCLDDKEKIDFNTFFDLANTNCLDCIFSKLQKGGCYTHKFMQFSGFISQLKSIVSKYPNIYYIPKYDIVTVLELKEMVAGKYVRFGTYGEPSLIPLPIIKEVTKLASNWTGYTHQWLKNKELAPYFMASVETVNGALLAEKMGFRSFFVASNKPGLNLVNCPASKEMHYKSACNVCNLCSGTEGTKSKKSVFIKQH